MAKIQTLFGSLDEEPQKPGFLDRMKQAVQRTRDTLTERIEEVVSIGKEIDRSTLDDLEATLLGADLGNATTQEVLAALREKVDRKQIGNVEELKRVLKDELLTILTRASVQPAVAVEPPEVILVVGVNGTGKTTTIGKLAARLSEHGRSVVVAAADTFRAAAEEQLEIWAERAGADFVGSERGADPAAVAFDAIAAAQARGRDVVIVDTAGRLHTQTNLMEELAKVRRVIAAKLDGAPHETLLVVDATTGQNGVQQARLFGEAAGVTGVALTKLDGSAKGGVALPIAYELGLPVKLIGIGERLEDLRPFDPRDFARALVS
jgi:fused signal recognition particle receptor